MTISSSFEGSRLFLNIPASVAHDARFKSDKSILLYGEIYSMINVTGTFFMSTNKIAERLRCSRTTVINCIHELKELGYIDTKTVKGKHGETKGRQISLTQGVQRTVLPPYSSLDEGGTARLTQTEHINRTTNKTRNRYIGQVEPDRHRQQREKIIDYLNSKLGTSYRANASKNKRLIDARLNEGYQLADFKKVIDHKYADWHDDQRMSKYLRPETLFGTKFEGYLNEKQTTSVLLTNEERDGHFG